MSIPPPLSESVLAALGEYDTPTICNVIELWNIRPRNVGYMNDTIVANFPQMPPMVGYALTSTFRSQQPPRSGDVYSSLTAQVDLLQEMSTPAVIVYQDVDEPTISATFGEVMCTTYQSFGAKGLITSGAGRDLDQVEAIGFPTFTGGTICAHGYCHTLAVNTPVTVGGITIYPHDLLHGDRNGVTTIPHDIASEIPDVCQELMAAENLILDYLKEGNCTSTGFAEAREAHGEAVKKLGKRIRGE